MREEPQDGYDPGAFEARWQQRWRDEGAFRADDRSARPPLYLLEFFPYPSGAGLSVGHCKNYVPADIYARMRRMQGFEVLHPMGWDAFGQPAENEAIRRGRHPATMVAEYAARYRRTLESIACSYDWAREFSSSDPDYYRHTQALFLLLHRRGLAYRPRRRSTGARAARRASPTRRCSAGAAGDATRVSRGAPAGSGSSASPPTRGSWSTTWTASTGPTASRPPSATGSATRTRPECTTG